MDKEKRVVKVQVTLSNGEVVNYEGKEIVVVLGGLENDQAVTLVDGSLPFTMYAHDEICEAVNEKKTEFGKDINELIAAMAASTSKPH